MRLWDGTLILICSGLGWLGPSGVDWKRRACLECHILLRLRYLSCTERSPNRTTHRVHWYGQSRSQAMSGATCSARGSGKVSPQEKERRAKVLLVRQTNGHTARRRCNEPALQ